MCAAMGPATPLSHSVVCLPGLAAPQPTFIPWQTALAADPAKPRLVLALDYRGHGQSQYDRNPRNYTVRVALADLSAVLAALEITSRHICRHVFRWRNLRHDAGGTARRLQIAGVLLNDIGPVMEPRGLMRIKSYVGKLADRTQLRRGRGNPALAIRGARSRSSHLRIGSRLPSALGASTAVRSCPITI